MKTYWASSNFKEIFPDIVSTYTDSLVPSLFNDAFREQYKTYGVTLPKAAFPIVKSFSGKLYMNFSVLGWIAKSVWGSDPSKIAQSIGGHTEAGFAVTDNLGIKPGSVTAVPRALFAGFRANRRQIHKHDAQQAWRYTYFAEPGSAQTAADNSPALTDAITLLRASLQDHLHVGVLANALYQLTKLQLDRFLDDHANRSSLDLLGHTPDAPNVLRHSAWQELVKIYRNLKEDQNKSDESGFNAALLQFLKAHGHRGVYEMEISIPRPVEDVEAFKASITGFAIQSPAPAKSGKRPETSDNLEIRGGLLSPLLKLYIRQLLKLTRWSMTAREKSKSVLAMDVYYVRQALLTIARENPVDGLGQTEDIFNLQHEEVDALTSGNLPSARVLVQGRRCLTSTRPPEDDFCEAEDGQLQDIEDSKLDQRTGVVVSAGTVTGFVCVVTSVADIARIKRGDIVVVKAMDSGWNEVFSLAAGIIAETGGMLSHAAILARENSVPALFNLRHATRYLRSGEFIKLNCAAGQIEKPERAFERFI